MSPGKSLQKKTSSRKLYGPGTPTLSVLVQKAGASVKSNYFPPVALNRQRLLLNLITLQLFGRISGEGEAPILWKLKVKSQLTGKDPNLGKD